MTPSQSILCYHLLAKEQGIEERHNKNFVYKFSKYERICPWQVQITTVIVVRENQSDLRGLCMLSFCCKLKKKINWLAPLLSILLPFLSTTKQLP